MLSPYNEVCAPAVSPSTGLVCAWCTRDIVSGIPAICPVLAVSCHGRSCDGSRGNRRNQLLHCRLGRHTPLMAQCRHPWGTCHFCHGTVKVLSWHNVTMPESCVTSVISQCHYTWGTCQCYTWCIFHFCHGTMSPWPGVIMPEVSVILIMAWCHYPWGTCQGTVSLYLYMYKWVPGY